MTHIAKDSVRPYRSALRAEQAEDTRSRILDAALRVMATGMASLSIPAVAREAGVSVPTVYRHFGTKADLLGRMYPHAARRAGLDRVPDPKSVDELKGTVLGLVERLDALSDVDRAAYASPIADEVRHVTMPSRIARLRKMVASIEPPLPAADQDRIIRLLVVLVSLNALRTWRDHLGVPPDQAAEDVVWIVRAAIAAAHADRASGAGTRRRARSARVPEAGR
jgi:AcrR family transcriptional regulator